MLNRLDTTTLISPAFICLILFAPLMWEETLLIPLWLGGCLGVGGLWLSYTEYVRHSFGMTLFAVGMLLAGIAAAFCCLLLVIEAFPLRPFPSFPLIGILLLLFELAMGAAILVGVTRIYKLSILGLRQHKSSNR